MQSGVAHRGETQPLRDGERLMIRKIWRGFTLFLTAVAILLVGVGQFMTSEFVVERDIVIDAPPERVYDALDDFETFKQWSPWSNVSPPPGFTLAGAFEGRGASLEWESNNPRLRSGRLEIIDVDPPDRVVIAAQVAGAQDPEYRFLIAPSGSGSRLTWRYSEQYGWDLVARYLGLASKGWASDDAEQSLANIKELLES